MMTNKAAKFHFVYLLRCADDSLYAGYTTNLEKRLSEHNGDGKTKAERSAGAKYTRPRRPVRLVYSERFSNRSAAMQREYALKRLTKVEKEELIRRSEGSINL